MEIVTCAESIYRLYSLAPVTILLHSLIADSELSAESVHGNPTKIYKLFLLHKLGLVACKESMCTDCAVSSTGHNPAPPAFVNIPGSCYIGMSPRKASVVQPKNAILQIINKQPKNIPFWELTHSKTYMSAVTFEELETLLEEGEGEVLIVDVRSTEEFSHGRIPFSVCIPLPQLPEAFEMPPNAFQQKFGAEKPGLQDQIIVTCK